ncbi:MAG: hypothetical protein KJZ83_18900 [Burkholderiaceae bacterium]|nr:hypothetical protein [Burkholderiaceae bacterium]
MTLAIERIGHSSGTGASPATAGVPRPTAAKPWRHWLDRVVVVLSLLLFAPSSSGTIASGIGLAEAYRQASSVVLVRLVQGQTIDGPGLECGVRYAGVVVRSFKGAPEGARVEFGSHYYYRKEDSTIGGPVPANPHALLLGDHYLVFLMDARHEARSVRWASTNGWYIAARREMLAACEKVLLPLSVMNWMDWSTSAMRVDAWGRDHRSWLIRWSQYIRRPDVLRAVEKDYVELGSFEKVVKALGRNR